MADFGIALAVSQAGGTRLTETGLSLGTPHYVSPEQAVGDRELDARTDVYSLGAVTYEMLTGDPPHTGNTVQAIMAKVLTEDPSPISRTRQMVPANVEAAVQCALAKSAADRFKTAADYAAALANPAYRNPHAPAAAKATEHRGWLAPLAVYMTLGPSSPRAPRFSTAEFEGDLDHVTYDVSADDQRFVMIKRSSDVSDPKLVMVEDWFEELKERMRK